MFDKNKIFEALAEVMDPEIPTLSVIDLGMITGIDHEGDSIIIKMIPTFTACPAIAMIKNEIKKKVESLECGKVQVLIDTEQTWNSNRITPRGKELLQAFGLGTPAHQGIRTDDNDISRCTCPLCGSDNTTMKSVFGSTLCRSTHYCFNCKQVFERFKPVW